MSDPDYAEAELYARLSGAAYGKTPTPDGARRLKDSSELGIGAASSYYGVAYEVNGKIVISNAGSVQAIDWKQDIQLLASVLIAQFDDAIAFTEEIARTYGVDAKDIVQTGHSLGGADSIVVSIHFGSSAIVFNPVSVLGFFKSSYDFVDEHYGFPVSMYLKGLLERAPLIDVYQYGLDIARFSGPHPGNIHYIPSSGGTLLNGFIDGLLKASGLAGNTVSILAEAIHDHLLEYTIDALDKLAAEQAADPLASPAEFLQLVAAETGLSLETVIYAYRLSVLDTLKAAGSNPPPPPDNSFTVINTAGSDPSQSQTLGLGTNYLNGLLAHGGTWQIHMPGSVLNGNGLVNVSQSALLSDWWRPGAGELSDYNLSGYLQNSAMLAWNSISTSFFDSARYFDAVRISTYTGLDNVQTMSIRFLNIDPLVLDIAGGGIRLANYQEANVLFSMDSDAYREQTGWIKNGTGFLVLDKNGDGAVNDVSEIFSEYFTAGAANGLAALATLDGNHDGIFTAADAAYAQVRVWQDTNGNGQTEPGELATLASLGISSISLTATPGGGALIAGNEVLATSTMVINGATHAVAAVNFLTNPDGHEWDLASQGLIIRSETGNASYAVSDPRGATVNVAAQGVNSAYGGSGKDTLIGDATNNWLGGGPGSDTLSGGAGDDVLIIDAADLQANIDGGAGFDIVQIVGGQGVYFRLSDAHVELAYGGIGDDILIGGGSASVFIGGGGGNDILIGSTANDALSGNDGHDVIDGDSGDDVLRGGRGEDLILGSAGNDIIDGGLDNDVLEGGDGNDVFISSGGNDLVDGGSGTDTAHFSGGFSEYTRAVLADGSIVMTDHVAARDGTVTMKNVEFFNFKGLIDIGVSWDPPMPANDTVTINDTGAQTILASALLANDIDYQNNPLHITAVMESVGGTAALNGSGNVVFTPTPGYGGAMSFKYTVADSQNNPGLTVEQTATSVAAEMKATVTLQTTSLPADPLFANQWYLMDANIVPVWKDYTGKGVTVGVFEFDIFDYAHPDLVPNVSSVHPNSVYAPEFIAAHTTLVAGVIGAARNGQGGVGVAYDAQLAAQRFSPEVDPLFGLENYVHYDVVNNSWGFVPPFNANFALFPPNQAIVKNAAAYGRDGLGTIMVFAAGNDRAAGGDANSQDFNSSRFGIDVGAINRVADVGSLVPALTPFSVPGASLLVSAPGSYITSTSLLLQNQDGASFGGNYQTVEGTSFATPVVSGIAALMLQANPNLGYRDVQKILAYSATSVNDPSTAWQINGAANWNGGGLHVSRDYGFGAVDALAAVRLAESWNTVQTAANEVSSIRQSGTLHAAIPDGSGSLVYSLSVSDALQVEHVEVQLRLNHAQLGDLVVTLIAPDGTQSVLLNRLEKTPGSSDAEDRGYGALTMPILLNSTHYFGQNSVGTWQLKIEDKAGTQSGTLEDWELRLYGQATSPDTTYIYTNEFATAAGAQRQTLTDSTGIDTINAAAVTAASTIDLVAGHSSAIAGRILTISGSTTIENAYTGDGNDTLTGNGADNILSGGRGADALSGSGGNDTLDGGPGNDTLTGGSGADIFIVRKESNASDTVTDFSLAENDIISVQGFDTSVGFSSLVRTQAGAHALITLPGGQTLTLNNVTAASLTAAHFNFGTILLGTAGNDSLTGTAADEIIRGVDGNDTLNGGGGNDTIIAGSGASTLSGGDGNDVLRGGSGNDTLRGNNHDDTIYGNDGNDNITGDDGADSIYGGNGTDTIDGGGGNDNIYSGNGLVTDLNSSLNNESTDGDIIHGGSGDDTLHGEGGNDMLYGDDGNDTIYAGNGGDTVDGGAGNDKIFGGLGSDILYGGAGNDEIHGEFAVTDTTGKNDVIHGGDGDDVILAGFDNDILYGDAGDDSLNGGGGDDIVHGGPGGLNDLWGDTAIAGGAIGSDRFVITPEYGLTAQNIIHEDVIWDIDPRDQNERIDLSAFGVTFADFGTRLWYLTGTYIRAGTSHTAGYLFIRDTAGTLNTSTVLSDPHFKGIVVLDMPAGLQTTNLILTTHDGPYWGTENGDTLTGSDDNDTMYGGGGNDTLNGGSGKDQLYGGAGDDQLRGSGGADMLDGGAGNNWADYSDSAGAITVNLNSTVQTSSNTINNFSYGDTLVNIQNVYGSSLNDILTGDAGDNILDGRAGADTIDGGAGSDTAGYAYSPAAVTVNLATNANTGGHAQGDLLSNIENIIGSAFNDTLTGASTDNTIQGGAGADTMNGGAGIDTLSYSASPGAVTVNIGTSAAQSGSDAQGDTVSGFENLTGSAFNDTLTGNTDANVIDAGAGNDVIYATKGADKIDGGEGEDVVSFADLPRLGAVIDLTTRNAPASSTKTAPVNHSPVNLVLNQGTKLTNVENVIGSATNDTIIGSKDHNVLSGGGGNDTFNATAGGDDIDGGDGRDMVSFALSFDAVSVNLSTGSASGGYATDISLTSIEDLAGSAFADTLIGTAGANALKGNAGNDTLSGLDGNDSLRGDDGNDNLSGGKGDDTLWGGNGDDSLYDEAGTNILYGEAGNDKLTGSAGNDTMRGGTGNDLLSGGNGTNMLYGEEGDDKLYGGLDNDSLYGGSGKDILTGHAGNDLLVGGTGKDTLTGGAGADIFRYDVVSDSPVTTRDIIADFNSLQGDKIDLSAFAGSFSFRGTGAFTGTAPEINYVTDSANTLIGVDVNGNGVMDMQIELTGLPALTAGDFLL